LRGRKAITRSPSTLQRRRAIPREALWLELKNRSPMSPQVKMKTLSVSSSPIMKFHFHHRLCASWLKVTVSDGESDDRLDPNEFSNLIHEYTYIIKREKDKVKKLESAHVSRESSHNNLLAK
jgi:hypothetical protein